MAFVLQPMPLEHLQALAAGSEPSALTDRMATSALPPPAIARRALAQLREGKSPAWCGIFYIADRLTGRVVGTCGFKSEPDQGLVEIGYGVSPDHRQAGVATEAVAQLLAIAAGLDPSVRVLAQISADNLASTRVAQKLAFSADGTRTDPEGEDLVQWLSPATAAIPAIDAVAASSDEPGLWPRNGS